MDTTSANETGGDSNFEYTPHAKHDKIYWFAMETIEKSNHSNQSFPEIHNFGLTSTTRYITESGGVVNSMYRIDPKYRERTCINETNLRFNCNSMIGQWKYMVFMVAKTDRRNLFKLAEKNKYSDPKNTDKPDNGSVELFMMHDIYAQSKQYSGINLYTGGAKKPTDDVKLHYEIGTLQLGINHIKVMTDFARYPKTLQLAFVVYPCLELNDNNELRSPTDFKYDHFILKPPLSFVKPKTDWIETKKGFLGSSESFSYLESVVGPKADFTGRLCVDEIFEKVNNEMKRRRNETNDFENGYVFQNKKLKEHCVDENTKLVEEMNRKMEDNETKIREYKMEVDALKSKIEAMSEEKSRHQMNVYDDIGGFEFSNIDTTDVLEPNIINISTTIDEIEDFDDSIIESHDFNNPLSHSAAPKIPENPTINHELLNFLLKEGFNEPMYTSLGGDKIRSMWYSNIPVDQKNEDVELLADVLRRYDKSTILKAIKKEYATHHLGERIMEKKKEKRFTSYSNIVLFHLCTMGCFSDRSALHEYIRKVESDYKLKDDLCSRMMCISSGLDWPFVRLDTVKPNIELTSPNGKQKEPFTPKKSTAQKPRNMDFMSDKKLERRITTTNTAINARVDTGKDQNKRGNTKAQSQKPPLF